MLCGHTWPSFQGERMVVEVGHMYFEPKKGLSQCDLLFHLQIIAVSREPCMWCLLYLEYDLSSPDIYVLISCVSKLLLVAVLGSFLDEYE